MKNLLYLLAVIASVTFIRCDSAGDLSQPDAQDPASVTPRSADMITICHLTGNGEYAPLEVNVNAVAGHLGHGDYLPDADGDGYTAPGACIGNGDDCDDSDPTIYPGATEVPDDGIDQDCDGEDEVTLVCRCFSRDDLQALKDLAWSWGWWSDVPGCKDAPYQNLMELWLTNVGMPNLNFNVGVQAGEINGNYLISWAQWNHITQSWDKKCDGWVSEEDYLPCRQILDEFIEELKVTHPSWDYCVRFP